MRLGDRIYRLIGNGPMSEEVAAECRNFAEDSISLGLTNTRHFVIQYSSYLLDNLL